MLYACPIHLAKSTANITSGLGFLPGLLHAWYIIAITPDPTYMELSQDAEGGHVTYYYVQTNATSAQGGYGTVNSTPNSQFPSQHQGFVQPPGAQAGPSDEVPPTYQQAVGDNKVQKP